MARRENLDRAIRLHKAVTRKISRIKKREGTYISGSGYDPRIDRRSLKSMNDRELQKYANSLGEFLLPTTTFTQGKNRVPLSSADWHRYKELESKIAAQVESHMEKYSHIRLPNGTSMEDRVRIISKWQSIDSADPTKLHALHRYQIRGKSGLDSLIKRAEERLANKDWSPDRSDDARLILDKMMKNAAMNEKIIDKARNLNDEQLNVLWNYTGFPDLLGTIYQNKIEELGAASELMAKYAESEAFDLVEWAGKI